jgi:hypothetical protein
MTTSLDILDLTVAALAEAGTDAQDRIWRPGDMPTQSDQYPNFRAKIVSETRISLGRDTVHFTTTCVVRLTGEVSAPAEIGNVNASTAETKLWSLKRQAEIAIVNSYPLFAEIQQLASVQSQLAFTSEAATHLAGIQIDLAFEFYEGPENFAPIEAEDITDIELTASNYSPLGLSIDPSA